MHLRIRFTVVLGAAMLAFAGGCQRSKVAQTLDATIDTKSEAADLEFWHQLPGRSAVTNNEGLHGVLLLSEGGDPTVSWDERLALVKERGWVVEDFSQAGDETIDRGTLAKALCHALNIKGGVMMQLTHTMPRYALRELTYLRVMAASTQNQIVNGLDYIGILSKAQDYAMMEETKKAKAAAPPESPVPPESAAEEAAPAAEPVPAEGAAAEGPS